MRILMRTTYAGAAGCAQSGQVIDLPTEEARALIAGGYATAAASVESAVTAPSETADAAANRRKRK